MNQEELNYCQKSDIKQHNELWWFFKNPVKLIRYKMYLRKIEKSCKHLDNYCIPELNSYMLSK